MVVCTCNPSYLGGLNLGGGFKNIYYLFMGSDPITSLTTVRNNFLPMFHLQ